jgi:hypothetical protein
LWDIFICHASEDKEAIARPLADALNDQGFQVWYDEYTLKLGDSLRRVIDKGLINSTYGAVILSKSFFSKDWPQKELDGLVARERSGNKVILPIWHDVTQEEVEQFSPILAGKLATKTKYGLDVVVKEIIEVINTPDHRDHIPPKPPFTNQLIQKLRAGTDSERNRAARQLKNFDLPDVIDALLEATKYDKKVRYEALLSLYELKSKKARDAFIERLEDPSPRIRHISILALGEIGDTTVINSLQKIIDTYDYRFLNIQRKGGKGQRTNWGKSENVVLAKNSISTIQNNFKNQILEDKNEFLRFVYDLSNGNLTTPIEFSQICNEFKSLKREEIAGKLQYLEECGYLRHNGFTYYLTALGSDKIRANK